MCAGTARKLQWRWRSWVCFMRLTPSTSGNVSDFHTLLNPHMVQCTAKAHQQGPRQLTAGRCTSRFAPAGAALWRSILSLLYRSAPPLPPQVDHRLFIALTFFRWGVPAFAEEQFSEDFVKVGIRKALESHANSDWWMLSSATRLHRQSCDTRAKTTAAAAVHRVEHGGGGSGWQPCCTAVIRASKATIPSFRPCIKCMQGLISVLPACP